MHLTLTLADWIICVGALVFNVLLGLYFALRARRQTDLSQALVATGFSYDAAQREQQGLATAHVLGRVRDIRRAGSAALDLCQLAAGHVDAYWELDLSPWDHAAGALIASEAGCAVTDALGQPLDFSCGRGLEKNQGILAAPARVHGILLGAIKELGI